MLGLDLILTDSVENLKLDVSFNQGDTMPSSVSAGSLHSVPFLIFLNHSLLLVSNLVNLVPG